MRSITIGELKKIFKKYDDETEVYYDYNGSDERISIINPKNVLNIDTMEHETRLVLE